MLKNVFINSLFILSLLLMTQGLSAQFYDEGKVEYYEEEDESNNAVRFALDIQYNVPLADDAYDSGIGYGFNMDYMINPNMSIGVYLAYNSFAYIGNDKLNETYRDFLPYNLTFQYFFSTKEKYNLFLRSSIGQSIYKYINYTKQREHDKVWLRHTQQFSHLSGSLGAGVISKMSDNFYWNMTLNYTYIDTDNISSTYIGLNAGVIYELGF